MDLSCTSNLHQFSSCVFSNHGDGRLIKMSVGGDGYRAARLRKKSKINAEEEACRMHGYSLMCVRVRIKLTLQHSAQMARRETPVNRNEPAAEERIINHQHYVNAHIHYSCLPSANLFTNLGAHPLQAFY